MFDSYKIPVDAFVSGINNLNEYSLCDSSCYYIYTDNNNMADFGEKVHRFVVVNCS